MFYWLVLAFLTGFVFGRFHFIRYGNYFQTRHYKDTYKDNEKLWRDIKANYPK